MQFIYPDWSRFFPALSRIFHLVSQEKVLVVFENYYIFLAIIPPSSWVSFFHFFVSFILYTFLTSLVYCNLITSTNYLKCPRCIVTFVVTYLSSFLYALYLFCHAAHSVLSSWETSFPCIELFIFVFRDSYACESIFLEISTSTFCGLCFLVKNGMLVALYSRTIFDIVSWISSFKFLLLFLILPNYLNI